MAILLEYITDRNEMIEDPANPGQMIPNPNYGQTTVVEHEVPDPVPVTLAAPDFFSYCWGKLGGGDVGMNRLQEIQDDAFAAGGAAKGATRQIDRATSFTKAQATALLTPIKDAGAMEASELAAILTGWPEA